MRASLSQTSLFISGAYAPGDEAKFVNAAWLDGDGWDGQGGMAGWESGGAWIVAGGAWADRVSKTFPRRWRESQRFIAWRICRGLWRPDMVEFIMISPIL